MNKPPSLIGLLVAVFLAAAGSPAVTPQPEEFRLRSQWTDPLCGQPPQSPPPHLKILYEDAPDAVGRGQSWRGTPFQLGDKTYRHGLSLWLPYHGTGTVAARNASYYGSGHTPVEPYAFWSNAAQSLGLGIDIRLKDLDYPALRRLIAHWRQVARNYYGDFYPLTPWTRDDAVWMAWQFDRPEEGQGMVQAFRRDNSIYESARLQLRGLDAQASYLVTRLDTDAKETRTGRDLLETGLPVTIATRPEAATSLYQRQ